MKSRTFAEMPSQTKENYLKALYHLSKGGNKISISELSKEMEVRVPTANSMVKRLQENGWVIYEKYKPLEITEEGLRVAAMIIRKHRIAEMFLVEKMGFGWEEVHNIAEEIEHINSESFFDKMDEMLGYPTIDPHGSPIPDKEGKTIKTDYKMLSEIEVGQVVRFCALNNDSSDLLHYLNSIHLELGLEIEILKVEPYDQTITVNYNDRMGVTLSKKVSDRLLVKPLE